jgi:hypothetical protein
VGSSSTLCACVAVTFAHMCVSCGVECLLGILFSQAEGFRYLASVVKGATAECGGQGKACMEALVLDIDQLGA